MGFNNVTLDIEYGPLTESQAATTYVWTPCTFLSFYIYPENVWLTEAFVPFLPTNDHNQYKAHTGKGWWNTNPRIIFASITFFCALTTAAWTKHTREKLISNDYRFCFDINTVCILIHLLFFKEGNGNQHAGKQRWNIKQQPLSACKLAQREFSGGLPAVFTHGID